MGFSGAVFAGHYYFLGITIFGVLNALFVAIEFGSLKVRKSQLIEVQGEHSKQVTLEIMVYEAKVTNTDGRRVGQVHFRKLVEETSEQVTE